MSKKPTPTHRIGWRKPASSCKSRLVGYLTTPARQAAIKAAAAAAELTISDWLDRIVTAALDAATPPGDRSNAPCP